MIRGRPTARIRLAHANNRVTTDPGPFPPRLREAVERSRADLNAAEEIRDLKRAHCEVTELVNARIVALHNAIGSCAIALWIVAALLAIGLWRVW